MRSAITTILFTLPLLANAQIYSIDTLISTWNLDAAAFKFNVPNATLDSQQASSYIRRNWDLAARIDWGNGNLVFSPDPSTSTSTLVRRASSKTSSSPSSTQSIAYPATTDLGGESPVLRVGYPQGSYSKRTGGTQFYAQPLNSTSSGQGQTVGNSSTDGQYERMLLSYDVWFPAGFAWNMGGKLPGLRGGPDTHGCSGGNETDGTTCFSTRLMWRSGGAGEVYAYIPTTQSNFCQQSQITCNSDYGTSLARGSFSFATGQWQTIYLLVVLNSEGTANGVIQLYYNGVRAFSFENLVLRTAPSIQSIGGLFFSTFFGGDDDSWSTPTQQYTYYKNMALYAGYGSSNASGSAIKSSSAAVSVHGNVWTVLGGVGLVSVAGLVGMLV